MRNTIRVVPEPLLAPGLAGPRPKTWLARELETNDPGPTDSVFKFVFRPPGRRRAIEPISTVAKGGEIGFISYL